MAAIARSSSSKISMTGEEGAASPRPMTGGVGLGLSIARTIAEGHEGSIGFANRAEGGLRATVILPLDR